MARTYITHELLLKEGFKKVGCFNNRILYTKGKFTIIEHNGDYVINYNSDSLLGKEIKTIEGIRNQINKQIDKINKQIDKIKKELNILNG